MADEVVLAPRQGVDAHKLCRLPGGSSFHPLEASLVRARAGGGSANRTRTPTPKATGWISGRQQAPGGSSGAWALFCGEGVLGAEGCSGGARGTDPPCGYGKGSPLSSLPPGMRCASDHSRGELWGAVGPVSGSAGAH